jgi:hypothetical protein
MLHTRYQHVIARALFAAGLVGLSASAQALNIDPSFTPQFLITNQTSALNADDVEFYTGFAGQLAEVYKQDDNSGGFVADVGAAAPFYSTVITPAGDPSNAVITWGGSSIIVCPTCYLVVKDGNNNPNQYIFDISGWNGQETLNLSGFWAGTNGSISHVAIFNDLNTEGGGGTIAAIPEADTYAMMLAGLGLVGFMAKRRKQVEA